MANATSTPKTDVDTKPAVKKTADERLKSALSGFATVVPASVSEAEQRRDEAEAHVKNLFAGVASQLDPERFETTEDVRDSIAKAFSSLKRSQTAFLKAVGATSDDATATLPGVESPLVEAAPEV